MTSSQNVREIAFPDHTAEGFDPTVPFEAPNGTTYLWNGWGWDVVPKGVGGGDSEPDPRLPYLIETDKVTRKTKGVRDQGPEIDLVDAEGNYSNVKFEARNGVVVSSTPSSIVIDGTEEQEARESADNALNDLIVKKGEQFEADQQRQDETAAKDQLRQDEALAAEIATRQSKDQQHDGQLSTIEYKLDALIGLQFKGTYTFKLDEDCFAAYQQCVIDCAQDYSCITECTRAQAECESQKIAPGFFEAIDPDGQFDNLTQIIISKNDKSGMEIDWGSVLSKGDYLEVDHMLGGVNDKTNYGLYRISEEPETTTNANDEPVYILQLVFLQGDGEMVDDELYEIRGITAAEGVNPDELADFLTKKEASETYSYNTHNHDDLTTTVSVHSTVTLDAGSKAIVTNEGTDKNASFKFQIPKGDRGAKGNDGSDGKNGKDFKIKNGTETSPTLSTGEMYWNTKSFVLYIGK